MVTLFRNGRVYSPGSGFSDSFAVRDDRFLAPEDAKNPDRVVDLGGKFVCPGFIDTHMHLVGFGRTQFCCDLGPHTGSLAEVQRYMRDFLREHPPAEGDWLFARGWNEDLFTDVSRPLTRYDLDEVSRDVPIFAGRTCGHCTCVNSKALELIGAAPDMPVPDGGRIGVENGVLTGMFYDNAINILREHMPLHGVEEIKKYIESACRLLLSYGVTSSMTDDFTKLYRWQEVTQAYRELDRDGRLPVRIYQQCYFDTPAGLNAFREAGFTTGVGTDFYRIGPLKMIEDGAVGAHTAYLTRPYTDRPDTCGAPVYRQAVLDEMVALANRCEMQVAIHTIGDACVDMALDAFEKAFAEHPREDHRDTLIHCLVTRPDQLPRIRRLGLRVHFQSEFLDYHCRIAELRLGDRVKDAYAWKRMKDFGIPVSNSSDSPVEIPSPLRGIQLAVTRQSLDGSGSPLNLREAFSVEEAIAGYTSDAAPASFDEARKGKILPGMLADFVVLGEDPFACPATGIAEIPVLETWVGGRLAYCR